jgi:F-type H+-transporting ATPase subunit gamma
MSDTTASLRKKISGAKDLKSVVRTMKAVAASSIGQYEKSVSSLNDYYRTVEMGLGACFRDNGQITAPTTGTKQKGPSKILAVVFGSDQGLVGQFNDLVADYAVKQLATLAPVKTLVWAVGERVHGRLADTGLPPMGIFTVPNSVQAITPLVGQILMACEKHIRQNKIVALWLFYNRPITGAVYTPISQRLLPLDEKWRQKLIKLPWPTKTLPEVIGRSVTLRAFMREYLFVSIFRACAESLASENASRLAAMQRAEKNIDELLEDLSGNFHRLRQSGIDEELFDVISSFEALSVKEIR